MGNANFVDVDGAQIAYRVQGNGPAVVLVNGTGGQDVHWGPVIDRLSGQRAVISLNHSGAGDTVDDGDVLTLEKLSRQVLGVAEAAGAQRFDLIGYSLGSVIATSIAADYPRLVNAAVLLAGFLWGGDPGLTLQFQLWLDMIGAHRQAHVKLLLHSGLTPAFLTRLGTQQIEQMVERFSSMMNWEGYKRQVDLDLRVDIREKAQHVHRPVLVIGASQDRILPLTHSRALADSIPRALYKEVDAGHGVLFERPDEFIALATDFLFQEHD